MEVLFAHRRRGTPTPQPNFRRETQGGPHRTLAAGRTWVRVQHFVGSEGVSSLSLSVGGHRLTGGSKHPFRPRSVASGLRWTASPPVRPRQEEPEPPARGSRARFSQHRTRGRAGSWASHGGPPEAEERGVRTGGA